MNRYRYRSAFGAIPLIVLSLLATTAVAQEEPRATLRVATRLSAESPLDEAYWAASLDRAIARSPRVIDVRRVQSDGTPVDATNYLITVEVTAKIVNDGVKTVWRIIDPVDGTAFAEGSEEGPIPTTRFLDELQWIPLVEALEGRDILKITAPPGTRIVGIGPESILIDESGEAKLLVEMPEIYRWQAHKSGMLVKSGILALPNGNVPLNITLDPIRRNAVEAAVRIAFYPELRFYRSTPDDRMFFRIGFSQSLWAFRFTIKEDAFMESAYGGRFEPKVGYGFFLLDTNHKVRPYVSMDISLKLRHTNEAYLYFDPENQLGVTPAFGIDFARSPRSSTILEGGVDTVGEFDDFSPLYALIGMRIRF